jgi:mRNA interferase MazF
MVDREYVPARGDIVWLSFTPQAGHEQAGRRPALTLSPEGYNEKTSLTLFCPITSSAKGYPFEVLLPATGSVSGVVLADQVKSLDWRARRASFESHAPRQVVGEALEQISVLLE